MAIKKVHRVLFKDLSTYTNWETLDISDVDKVLEDRKESYWRNITKVWRRKKEIF